ncbi:MAG: U32 family peptidase, partial [Candidatus Pacebacteria bacterium]|nr:U32 family peptidase [Candidatus Paceibacterota bacterium]
MKKNKFELMAPVGSFSSLVAACKAKADAVYLGLNDFSMRFGKNNFKVSDLTKIKKICNLYPQKPKVYVTLNTIVYDSEIKKLDKLIKKIKDKVDAVICWDFAVINLCKKYKVPFFISTQASVANKETAKFYQKLGAKRIVLARELDLKQIKEISKIKGLEIEVFIHGAMCVSISGRCFMSQFLFNKSANRGECFHPCRRSYVIKDEKYGNELKLENSRVMSAKDLCALPFIEELKKIKIKSFKIEGRNRDSRYVDSVVKVYRKALDNDLSKNEVQELMKELTSVYNRGFSSGFYLGKPTPKDFSEIENSASDTYKEF